jgi:hypothetical protein
VDEIKMAKLVADQTTACTPAHQSFRDRKILSRPTSFEGKICKRRGEKVEKVRAKGRNVKEKGYGSKNKCKMGENNGKKMYE